eukprot:447159-Pyramimonas_sp.AAC.2
MDGSVYLLFTFLICNLLHAVFAVPTVHRFTVCNLLHAVFAVPTVHRFTVCNLRRTDPIITPWTTLRGTDSSDDSQSIPPLDPLYSPSRPPPSWTKRGTGSSDDG